MRAPSSTSLFLIPFLHLLFFLSATTNALCIHKEKQALLDFKLSFVADPLNVLSSWTNSSDDCCSWTGVQCYDLAGHVGYLSLAYSYLKSNELRPSLAELKYLSSLILTGNQFTMRIPKFIGSLRNLVLLDLSNAGFFGEIPPHLGNLSNLQDLRLGQSNTTLYTHSLQWLSGFSSIYVIKLTNVNSTSTTDWASTLKMLPDLGEFQCISCFLPSPILPPVSHVNSTNFLQILDLSNTSVSPSTFSRLISGNEILILHLDNMNSETNIHELLASLSERDRFSLQTLSLIGSNLNSLPFEGKMFPSLTYLGASSNNISGSLPEILQHLPTNLTTLDLSANFLTGVISDSHFSKFHELDGLILSDNNLLTFNFSKGWIPPFQLETLRLSSCKVGPSFPNWIMTQTKLSALDISNSMISSAIPYAFWNFSTILSSLNISHNNINDKIPNLPLPFSSMEYIDLSSNTFHGSIPPFLFTAQALLDLSNNKFSSFLPFHIRVLSSVPIRINLSSNRLLGLLPRWLFRFDDIVSLNLENNKLHGTLPASAGSLWKLAALHLNNNSFSGGLPYAMKNCTRLAILELANNMFSGPVPTWLGESIPTMVVLTLRSNNFSGGLPSSLCHIQSLQVLDLSENQLSGPIPGCFQNFTSMVTNTDINLDGLFSFYINGQSSFLDHASVIWKGALADMYGKNLEHRNAINLSGNRLSGEIPIGVTALKELRILDLSRNYLNGSIPDQIGQLTSLESLELSSNRLSGEIPQSLATLTFLGTLDLSNNNLSGRIPTGTQLQTFDASSFAGNPKLCGKPLLTGCPGDDKPQPTPTKDAPGDKSFDIQAFLAASGIGFAFGLLGVFGMLHFNRPCRHAFFLLVDIIADRTFVAAAIFKNRIKRRLCFKKANGAADM